MAKMPPKAMMKKDDKKEDAKKADKKAMMRKDDKKKGKK